MKQETCIFCKIANHEIPSSVIYENDHVLVFMALENHPLVIPKNHAKDIYDLSDIDGAEIMKAAIKISKAVKTALKCDGINLVQSSESAAGQEVFHFHLHIMPRWENDSMHMHWDTTTVAEVERNRSTELIKSALQA